MANPAYPVGLPPNVIGSYNPINPQIPASCAPCKNDPLYNGCRPLVNPCGPQRAVTTWRINYLISNRNNQAAHTDIYTINPWGIVIHNAQLWIADSGSDSVTNFDFNGNALLGPISLRDAAQLPAYPSGIAVNCGGGFSITNGTVTRSSIFIVATELGIVETINPSVSSQSASIVINQLLTGEIHVYKGIALGPNIMYLADFLRRAIDVFDSDYNPLVSFPFVDGDGADPIPMDYSPFNIVYINCFLYVLWARKNTSIPLSRLDGPGHGYISVFNPDGTYVKRFTSRGVLNSPWAMIPAPCECGFPPGSFLVGNHGDGRINVFDCNGKYVGPVLNQYGQPMVLDGLWGMAPFYSDFNEIFFASAEDENYDGLVGSFVRDQVIIF